MNIQQDVYYMKFSCPEKIEVEKRMEALEGKLLFGWPYQWKGCGADVYSDEVLVAKVALLLEAWLNPKQSQLQSNQAIVNDIVLAYLSVCPLEWKLDALKANINCRKIVTGAKFSILMVFFDDIFEISKSDRYGTSWLGFVKAFSREVGAILRLELGCISELHGDTVFKDITSIEPKCGFYLEMLLDLAQDFKMYFGATRDSLHYLASSVERQMELQTFRGSKIYWHPHNRGLYDWIRRFTIGYWSFIELILLVEGISVPMSIREGISWNRCLDIFSFLFCRVNDVVSFPKEVKSEGSLAENIVCIYMKKNNSTAREAISIALAEHDLALREIQYLYKFLYKSNKQGHSRGSNRNYDDILLKSVDIMTNFISYYPQSSFLMKRYKLLYSISIENEQYMSR